MIRSVILPGIGTALILPSAFHAQAEAIQSINDTETALAQLIDLAQKTLDTLQGITDEPSAAKAAETFRQYQEQAFALAKQGSISMTEKDLARNREQMIRLRKIGQSIESERTRVKNEGYYGNDALRQFMEEGDARMRQTS